MELNNLDLFSLQVDTSWDSTSSTILDVISTVAEYKECQHFCQVNLGSVRRF